MPAILLPCPPIFLADAAFLAFIGHVELCWLLMEYHTDKNPKDFCGQTPFNLAASKGHLEVCKLFMDTCVNENHMDDEIRRPLQRAAWNGHLELCKILMAYLMDKKPRDHIGQTPFHSATLEVYRLFMKTCMDKNCKEYALEPSEHPSKLLPLLVI